MDHFEEAITLATSNNGVVKICPPGCIHLLFGRITLNFESPAEFREMVESIKQQGADEEFGVSLGNLKLHLTPEAREEILGLFEDAITALAWSDGELKFADETLHRFLRDNQLSE